MIVFDLAHEVQFLEKQEHYNPQDPKNYENPNYDQQHVKCVQDEASEGSHVGSNCLFVDFFVANAIEFGESERQKKIM